MKRIILTFAFFLAITSITLAQNNSGNMNMPAADKLATLMNGLGSYHHAVSTTNKEAQRFFDQGFTLVYAFNHEAAIRSFKRAAELDPQMAMAYWGSRWLWGRTSTWTLTPNAKRLLTTLRRRRSLFQRTRRRTSSRTSTHW